MLFFILFFSCAVQAPEIDSGYTQEAPPVVTHTSEFYPDQDRDGYGDPNGTPIVASGVSGGSYVDNNADCDDGNSRVKPGESEVCDGVDNNCDGKVDNAPVDREVWYLDGDGDGFGDQAVSVKSCDGVNRFVADSTDCDDMSPDIHPGKPELCDNVDNNCNGSVDEGAVDAKTWYLDYDGDGRGGPWMTEVACERPDGYMGGDNDCDDENASVYPGAPEYCDELDNDCDDIVDEDGAVDGVPYYVDNDQDGYGDNSVKPTSSCVGIPEFGADQGGDCDDMWPDVHPDAEEFCDWYDNDCDGLTDSDDPDVVDAAGLVWYEDDDCDGYGGTTVALTDVCELNAYMSSLTCVSREGDDCNDDPFDVNAGMVNPGVDMDGDGWSACDDCDDYDHSVYPDATEFANGVDDDCDGSIDE